jgi:methionine-rich copper-binding protein CopC
VLLGLWLKPVGAHTALLQASPGPDETAGGTIDFIDLAFLDPITNAIVTVTFNGEPVAGRTIESDGEVVRFELDQPLQAPGRYQVFYEMTSYDGDYTTSGFFFTFAADGPQPERLTADSGGSSFPVIPTVIGSVVLIALLGVFVWQFDARRRGSLAADDRGYYEDDDHGGYYEDHDRDHAGGYSDYSYGAPDSGDRDRDTGW